MKLLSTVVCFSIMFGVSSAQTCLICEDGSVPQYSDTLLKFFPGTLPLTEYTCKELHFLGMYNDGKIITPEICTFLVRLASFSCGCRGDEAGTDENMSQKSETQIMDVTVSGSSSDVILSSTFVTNKDANLTKTAVPTYRSNPTTAPLMSLQSDFVSDFPSSNPTMDSGGTLAPSFSPYSTEVISENFFIEEKLTDQNESEVAYHSTVLDIIQKLKNFLLRFEKDEKLNILPNKYGKLRGM